MEGKVIGHRIRFDDAFRTIVSDGRMYYGSTVDHQVHCVDLATGRELWTFFTGGPVRLPPAVSGEHILFGSDDGRVYCLRKDSGKLKWEMRADGPVLVKLPEIEFVDDREGKPAGIQRFIGRRPILAFGNSDGDHAMLQWTVAGSGPRLAALVHHTDAAREWAYDRTSHIGRLDAALDEARAKGWTVVSMKDDWARIFPE